MNALDSDIARTLRAACDACFGMTTVWPLVERGDVHPVIDTTLPLDRAAEAHRRLEGSDHVGKVLLTV